MSAGVVSLWPFNCVECGQRYQSGAVSHGSGSRGARICSNCYKLVAQESNTETCPTCFVKHKGECW